MFDEIYWKLKGIDVYKYYRDYARLQWDDVDIFRARQNRKIMTIINYTAKNIPFYQNIITRDLLKKIANNPLEGLSSLPILTKEIVKNNLDDLYIKSGRGVFKNSTGGSTGRPVTFYQDKAYLTDSLAANFIMYVWAGKLPGKKYVKFWGAMRDLVDGHIGWKQKTLDLIANRITLNAFSLTAARMDSYHETIANSGSLLLEGYADGLFEFAKYLNANNKKLSNVYAVVSSAGTLFPFMRDEIEKAFASRVFDRYGSREAGNIAAECDQHEGLHVFGETTIVEIVDDDGREVAEGCEGRVLVTNLVNFTMPLLRYEIGDRAIKGKRLCSCGRPYPLLQAISGRQSGSLKRVDGGVVGPEFFIHCIGVVCNDGAIDTFQIVQNRLSEIHILIKPSRQLDLDSWEMKNRITDYIKKAMGDDCSVIFELVNDIPKTPTGKHLYTVCNIEK